MIFVKSKYMRVIEPGYRLGLTFKAQLQLVTFLCVIHEQAEQAAADDERSLSGLIIKLLRDHLKKRKQT